jgi:hypothetical protein
LVGWLGGDLHGETSWATYEFTGSPPTGEWSGGLNDFGLKAYDLISLRRDYLNLDLSIFEDNNLCQPATGTSGTGFVVRARHTF